MENAGGVFIIYIYKGKQAFWKDRAWQALFAVVVISLAVITALSVQGRQVTIHVDGKSYSLYTFKESVQEVILQSGIYVGERDIVTPSLASPVKEHQNIKITRVTQKYIYEEQVVPFKIIRKPDYRLPKGIEIVKQNGANGLKQLVHLVTLHDGVEVGRKLVKTKIINKPQPKVIVAGKRTIFSTVNRSVSVSRAVYGDRLKNKRTEFAFNAEATAYTFTGNNTATGITPFRGVVAVDPRVIPLGTKLYVEGYGECIALDTGGAIKGSRIDVFFPTREEAIKWGRKMVKVHVLTY
uniref:3D domain-containing protein n=1 Tax=Desulforadius tongensis TaxID=1216062 RepID=UPI00195A57AA|nr:3D domain-containing protein [Desulforadius tongensis]